MRKPGINAKVGETWEDLEVDGRTYCQNFKISRRVCNSKFFSLKKSVCNKSDIDHKVALNTFKII
jgi:hypothetical protein